MSFVFEIPDDYDLPDSNGGRKLKQEQKIGLCVVPLLTAFLVEKKARSLKELFSELKEAGALPDATPDNLRSCLSKGRRTASGAQGADLYRNGDQIVRCRENACQLLWFAAHADQEGLAALVEKVGGVDGLRVAIDALPRMSKKASA